MEYVDAIDELAWDTQTDVTDATCHAAACGLTFCLLRGWAVDMDLETRDLILELVTYESGDVFRVN